MPSTLASRPALDVAPSVARVGGVSWHLFAIAMAATLVIVGIVWDISWHMTIGRDTFWTPAHLCTYASALLVGITCGTVALRTTFAGSAAEREQAVRFWGFRAPLGAWIAVWGSIAMLTSAPFDDWWHNAYGLDVRIISPPHTLLALGMVAIVAGALVWTLASQNRARDGGVPDDERRRLAFLFVYAGGLLLSMVAVYVYDYTIRGYQHGSPFYRVMAIAFPMFLVAIARGSTLRWPAAAAALVFMASRILLGWILARFPATPKLGPIYNPLDHMAVMEFPILLVAPALAIDILLRRFDRPERSALRDWKLAPLLGLAFVAALLVAQWPFADFLHSAAARNWVFFTDRTFTYGMRPTGRYMSYRYFGAPEGAASLARGLALAVVWATLSARAGLGWGRWMTRVRR